ncbi:hypothetical protein Dimus_008137, partial [Dionaea muscipula]
HGGDGASAHESTHEFTAHNLLRTTLRMIPMMGYLGGEDPIEEDPKNDEHDGASKGKISEEKETNDVVEFSDDEEMEEEDPQDDVSIGASRDKAVDKVNVEPKSSFVENVLMEVMASIGVNDTPKEGQPLEMVVYQEPEPVATESSQFTPHIHDHFEQAVRSILDGMDQQNEGIKELFELLDSKIFTDNQKEKLIWGKLSEIKSYVESIAKELK